MIFSKIKGWVVPEGATKSVAVNGANIWKQKPKAFTVSGTISGYGISQGRYYTYYSTDGGLTWLPFADVSTDSSFSIPNIAQIMFKCDGTSSGWYIDTISSPTLGINQGLEGGSTTPNKVLTQNVNDFSIYFQED